MDGDECWTEDPDNDVSLMYMDRAGLEARIFHIDGRDSNSTDPTPYTAYLVTNVLVHGAGVGLVQVSASWLVNNYLRMHSGLIRSGLYEYLLRATPDGLKIKTKKAFVYDDRIVGPIDIYNI